MKKIATFIIVFALVVGFAGCTNEREVKNLEATRESVDNWILASVAVDAEDFIKTYKTQAQEQGVYDYLTQATAEFKSTSLSDFGYVMDKCSNTDIDDKYSYNSTEFAQTFYLYFDGHSKNIALEINDNNDSEYVKLTEVRELSDGRIAMQYYETTADGRYNLSQMLFSGKQGSVSYSFDLSVRPTRLYAAENPGDTFAKSGDDVFTMNDGVLTYTTERTRLSDVSSVKEWLSEYEDGVRAYYEDNLSKAAEIDRKESFEDYLLAFTRRDIAADIEEAMSGEYTSGMYVKQVENGSLILAYDNSAANISIRVTRGEDNYAFELRSAGKRKYSMHYYTKNEDGKYSVYKSVLRFEGDACISRKVGLDTKPTLVYSKKDNDLTYSWPAIDCDYYFTIESGELEFHDYELEMQQAGEEYAASEDDASSEE